MTRGLVVLALALMSGCATCERHKVACIVVTSAIVLSASGALVHGSNQGTRGTFGTPPDVNTQPVNCTGVSCQ